MFFLWAAEAPVEAMVVEVGLGGRWDATNVVDAPVSVVTNVGLDHTKLMGSDRRQIAREKSGIIKRDAVAVTAERDPAVLEVIQTEASGVGATISRLGSDFEVLGNRLALGGRHISVRTSGATYGGLFLPLHGAHQGVNSAVAMESVGRFLGVRPLDEEVVAEGLARAVVPGRLEIMRPGEGVAPVVFMSPITRMACRRWSRASPRRSRSRGSTSSSGSWPTRTTRGCSRRWRACPRP
jgi:dihydrofolate synthase/folylpolyglutamate synthase